MKNRWISDSIWKDAKVRTLSPTARLVWIHLLTSPELTLVGIYYCPAWLIQGFVGISLNEADLTLEEIEDAGLIMVIDDYVIIKNYIKYQRFDGSPIIRGCQKAFDSLPENVFNTAMEIDHIRELYERSTSDIPRRPAKTKKKKPNPIPKPTPSPEDITVSHDLRVVAIQNYIRDNGFDIVISDDDMLELVVKYGRDYTQRMVELYGDWRLISPTKASKHKKHIRAINAVWVHDKTRLTVLPNPNDELETIRWNVLISPLEKAELLRVIEAKLKEKDPHNQEQWLLSLADRVSGMKAKSGIFSTDMDANYILERIETQAKWSKK